MIQKGAPMYGAFNSNSVYVINEWAIGADDKSKDS